MKKRTLTIMLSCAMMLCAVIGTMAWLIDSTETVTNTFSTSDVDITLTETFNKDTDDDNIYDAWEAKMVPGHVIAKDPLVTVLANSEDCYVFVKVEKSENYDSFMEHAMAEGWTQLKDAENNDVAGVFYQTVASKTENQELKVLKDDQVKVLNTVTKAMMDAIEDPDNEATQPTLSFTAYAVQMDYTNDTAFEPIDAWKAINA